jgi:hypothetical protein
VTLGKFTVRKELFRQAKTGAGDPGWDFEPDELKIRRGTPIIITDQGGEPHTFTEVKPFGAGFIDDLNVPGEVTIPECDGGFANVAQPDPDSAWQPAADHRFRERRASFSVLHQFMDACESWGEMTAATPDIVGASGALEAPET